MSMKTCHRVLGRVQHKPGYTVQPELEISDLGRRGIVQSIEVFLKKLLFHSKN